MPLRPSTPPSHVLRNAIITAAVHEQRQHVRGWLPLHMCTSESSGFEFVVHFWTTRRNQIFQSGEMPAICRALYVFVRC